MRPLPTHGFTAIELMVTLAVVAVVAALAVPAWQQLTLKSRLNTTANGIYNALTQARQAAVTLKTPVTVCTGDATGGCQTGSAVDWAGGLIAFTDRDQDGILDTAERVLFTHRPSGGLVIAANTPMNKPIIFQPLGFAEQPGGAFSAGRVRVCAPKDFPGHAQDVVLLKSGMARVESAQFGGQCPAP